MRLRAALLLLGASLWLSAGSKLTVEQLVSFIRSAIQLKQPDRQVAADPGSVALTKRLDDETIEELRGEGAGPKTVEALKALREASQTLSAPAQPTPTPPPPPPSRRPARKRGAG